LAILQTDFLFLAMSNTFPKSEKLKSSILIEALFDKGKAVTKFPFKIIFLQHANPSHSGIKAGFVVPKKNFKSAVKRNRIKRLLREAYRRNKHTYFNNIEGNYALMILYLGKEIPTYDKVEKGVKALLSLFLEKISHEKSK
jgi:ribonuclease P protein component